MFIMNQNQYESSIEIILKTNPRARENWRQRQKAKLLPTQNAIKAYRIKLYLCHIVGESSDSENEDSYQHQPFFFAVFFFLHNSHDFKTSELEITSHLNLD